MNLLIGVFFITYRFLHRQICQKETIIMRLPFEDATRNLFWYHRLWLPEKWKNLLKQMTFWYFKNILLENTKIFWQMIELCETSCSIRSGIDFNFAVNVIQLEKKLGKCQTRNRYLISSHYFSKFFLHLERNLLIAQFQPVQ